MRWLAALPMSLALAAAAEPPAKAPDAEPVAATPDAGTSSASILPLDDRLEAFEQFRASYANRRFEEALPLAQRVVELAENGPRQDIEVPVAYNNLGATQYQLGLYDAAAASYLKSLELLETTQGISSRRMIVPLTGLGSVYAAQDHHDLAAFHFARALAVSRRADGLFNLTQLPLIEQAAASLQALADYAGVERERLYALRIAEQNYGYGDARTLPALLALARFYEGLREYVAARLMFMRMRDVTARESGGFSPDAIRALIGIARTHRLQYVADPESADSLPPGYGDVPGDAFAKTYHEALAPASAGNRAGLRAIGSALELLRAASDPPPQLMIDALIELGDWYQTTSRQNLATPQYEEAAAIVAAHPDRRLVNPLLAARMVFYRPPLAAARGLKTLPGPHQVRRTVFEFTVTEEGLPENVTVIESDMSEAQVMQSRRALLRAIYCPRFDGGKAVASEAVRFTSEWIEADEPDAEQEPATTPEPATPPEPAKG